MPEQATEFERAYEAGWEDHRWGRCGSCSWNSDNGYGKGYRAGWIDREHVHPSRKVDNG